MELSIFKQHLSSSIPLQQYTTVVSGALPIFKHREHFPTTSALHKVFKPVLTVVSLSRSADVTSCRSLTHRQGAAYFCVTHISNFLTWIRGIHFTVDWRGLRFTVDFIVFSQRLFSEPPCFFLADWRGLLVLC